MLSAITNCYTADVLDRAGDVCLGERRPVILMVRETPLFLGHLRLMTPVTEMGAAILSPIVALYHRQSSITDSIDHGIMKALDLLGLNVNVIQRWECSG